MYVCVLTCGPHLSFSRFWGQRWSAAPAAWPYGLALHFLFPLHVFLYVSIMSLLFLFSSFLYVLMFLMWYLSWDQVPHAPSPNLRPHSHLQTWRDKTQTFETWDDGAKSCSMMQDVATWKYVEMWRISLCKNHFTPFCVQQLDWIQVRQGHDKVMINVLKFQCRRSKHLLPTSHPILS